MFWLKFREHFDLVPTVDLWKQSEITWELWRRYSTMTLPLEWYERYFYI